MIQVERESADLRSDEIESRVNSGSMDGLNVTLRPRALPTSATAQSLASSCSPPNSGHSTPKHHSRNASHHLGIMTLVRDCTQTRKYLFGFFLSKSGVYNVSFCLTAKRFEEASQESGSEFASKELFGRMLASVMDFFFFFSLLWKWTKLLSSVRHRLHHRPAVYAWNPTLPSSQEAWRMDEGNRTLKHVHRQHSGAEHRV